MIVLQMLSHCFFDPILLAYGKKIVYKPIEYESRGKIYKCPGFVGKEDFVIGNLHDDALNHRNTQFMTVDLWKRCKDCPYIPLCGGGCRSSAYVKDGNFEERTCEKEYFEKVALELVKREYLGSQ